MKLALTYDNGEIFPHFGKSEAFKVYEIVDGNILNSEVISSNGEGHGALAQILLNNGVDALICGGIGGGAINALHSIGVHVFAGCSGNCDEVVDKFLKGELQFEMEPTCNCHHEHDHEDGNCSCHCH